ERKKRTYLSLFSSNVALTYRKSPQTAQAHEGETGAPPSSGQEPSAAQLAELVKSLQPQVPAPAQAPGLVQLRDSAAVSDRKEETKRLAAATGKTYVLFEGTVLETVLINRLDGQMAGPIECLLSNDVYSHDRQHLLLPAGSKLLGESR